MSKPNLMVIYGGGTVGGAEEYLYSLMKEIEAARFGRVVFASLGDAPLVKRVRELPVEVEVINYSHLRPFAVLQDLKNLSREKQISLINTHGLRSNTFGRLLGKSLKLPVVTTVHSILRFDYPNPLKRFVAQSMEKCTRPITKHFIAVSQAVAEDLVSQGLSKNQLTVIHNGIDLERFRQLTVEEVKAKRQELGIEPQEKVVSIIGRLHQVKGHKFFFEAANIVTKEYPKVKFLVVGDGPLRAELEKQVKHLGIEDKAIFTGFRSDINDLLNITDIYCLSSLMEGLPLSPLEAMALKKPVIASAVGGLKEIIRDERYGVLVPPADSSALAEKMLQLLQNDELAARIGEESRALVQTSFNSRHMVDQVEEIFLQCARG